MTMIQHKGVKSADEGTSLGRVAVFTDKRFVNKVLVNSLANRLIKVYCE